MKLATVAFYAFALGLLAVGLRELLTGFEENRCSMTYMFEYPEYRVSRPADDRTSHTVTYEVATHCICWGQKQNTSLKGAVNSTPPTCFGFSTNK